MKRHRLRWALWAIFITVVIIILLFVLLRQRQDALGNKFDNFYTAEKELLCCEDCLSYLENEDSKGCYEIIKDKGGIRTCYLVMREYPHTVSQCKSVVGE